MNTNPVDHLQNLAAAARHVLKDADMGVMKLLVAAIEWAESEAKRMREAPAVQLPTEESK